MGLLNDIINLFNNYFVVSALLNKINRVTFYLNANLLLTLLLLMHMGCALFRWFMALHLRYLWTLLCHYNHIVLRNFLLLEIKFIHRYRLPYTSLLQQWSSRRMRTAVLRTLLLVNWSGCRRQIYPWGWAPVSWLKSGRAHSSWRPSYLVRHGVSHCQQLGRSTMFFTHHN